MVAPTLAPAQSPPQSFQATEFEPTSPLLPPEAAPSRRTIPIEPPAALPAAVAFGRAAPTLPAMADRTGTEALIRRHYPDELERLGVGGSVRLLLWVDESGAVDKVQMARGSGIPGLDRAALGGIARELRFRPATSRGENVGTWVEFDVVFLAEPPESDASLSTDDVLVVRAPDDLDVEPFDLALIPEWRGEIDFLVPSQREARELLLGALPNAEGRFGSIQSILLGEPPAGVAPTQWRAEVSAALEEGMVRAPDNPAPLLSLARIRRKQGLKTEARVLFERGLQIGSNRSRWTSRSKLMQSVCILRSIRYVCAAWLPTRCGSRSLIGIAERSRLSRFARRGRRVPYPLGKAANGGWADTCVPHGCAE